MAVRLTDPAPTPWVHGRFDGRPASPRLLFGRTFEDPAIEDRLFPPTGTVLCIAAAGDTARSLAASGRSVIAVDVNPAQLAEVDRRIAGGDPQRGAAERLLALARAALVPLGGHPSRLDRFCDLSDPVAQVDAWRRLTSPIVQAVADAALSPRGLRLAYGAEFARTVPPRFGSVLLDRIGAGVARAPNRENPWLRLLLTGDWTASDPVAAEPVELRGGDVVDLLEAMPAASLDGISLSNVLDGPGPGFGDRLLRAAHRAGRPGSPIVVRSFLDGDADARRLAAQDRSLLWGGIAVHRATGGAS